jgi:hypothetical protein
MKVYVQWTGPVARDWEPVDSAEWPNFPKGPVPTDNETVTEARLWVHSINVQGVVFHSFDHYAIINNTVAVWNDDDDGWKDDHWGMIWKFNDPCSDPRIGGRINTKQSYILYAESEERREATRKKNIDILTHIRPFTDFPYIAQKYIGHGIAVEDQLNEEHLACRSSHGWREWIIE